MHVNTHTHTYRMTCTPANKPPHRALQLSSSCGSNSGMTDEDRRGTEQFGFYSAASAFLSWQAKDGREGGGGGVGCGLWGGGCSGRGGGPAGEDEQRCKPWWSTCSPWQEDRSWGGAERWRFLRSQRGHHHRISLDGTCCIFTLIWVNCCSSNMMMMLLGAANVSFITLRHRDGFVLCIEARPLDISVSDQVNQHDVTRWHHLQRVGGRSLTTLPAKQA